MTAGYSDPSSRLIAFAATSPLIVKSASRSHEIGVELDRSTESWFTRM